MKGTLHKTEDGWVVHWSDLHGRIMKDTPLHPDDEDFFVGTVDQIRMWDGTERDFEHVIFGFDEEKFIPMWRAKWVRENSETYSENHNTHIAGRAGTSGICCYSGWSKDDFERVGEIYICKECGALISEDIEENPFDENDPLHRQEKREEHYYECFFIKRNGFDYKDLVKRTGKNL